MMTLVTRIPKVAPSFLLSVIRNLLRLLISVYFRAPSLNALRTVETLWFQACSP